MPIGSFWVCLGIARLIMLNFITAQTSDEKRIFSASKKLESDSGYCWEDRKAIQTKKSSDNSFQSSAENEFSDNAVTVLSRHESLSSLSVKSFDSSELTPLEQALLEQCIHSGMPHKTRSKEIKNYSDAKEGSDGVDGNQGDNLNSSYGGHTWSEDYTSPNENSMTCNSSIGKIEGLKVVESESSKDEILLPNFKIGSEVRDPKFLQAEASKICREIRKYQEFDMSCSMTSEVSQVSCGSFLDSGEFSFIDLSKETGDLDASESLSLNKNSRKISNLHFRTAVLEEPISLPSVGSVKSDLQDVDLESSILSVASLTSEVAENMSKDKDNISYYNGEKTPENALDSPMTVFDRGDDTLNAETLGSDTEVFDDENSTMSQENLPLDPEDSKESTPKRSNKKLTPKEKRQMLQDRFRTYTIHDFKTKPTVETSGEGEKKKKKTTPKERRMNERDRFLTRVLGKFIKSLSSNQNSLNLRA